MMRRALLVLVLVLALLLPAAPLPAAWAVWGRDIFPGSAPAPAATPIPPTPGAAAP